ncbi:FAD-dependent monooxygenase [Streptomyces malaysiensis]|uniref:FAD-dependent monooxygenase n=1 Tax=Streptomyces malaysiensis TaxID=92644 RepID=UPI002B2EF90B|nr:FAD-dependent monooxygenase [Streptomyces malaysiensis]
MTTTTSIAVCGAGLGGLTAALALHQRGFEVTVYEQAEQLGEVGAGLQLSANAVRVFASLGLLDRLVSRASLPEGKQVRLWNTGKSWKLFDLGTESVERYGYPYLMMHRADLHDALREAFEARAPGRLLLGKRLAGFEEGADRVTLRFADDTSAQADVLVGADGVHSVIREQLFGDSDPKFSGCVAWRGVVPAADLPEHLRAPLGTNWIGPNGHVIQYPLRGGELVNFVGIVERDDWEIESWNTPGDSAECAADFKGWHPDVLALIEAVDTPMKWALKLRPTMTSWSSARVTLLGDACHPTLPFLAQGSAMAIEDGVVLARALERHPNQAEAFAAYEAARVTRTAAVVDGSAANTDRFHNPVLADPNQADAYVEAEWSQDNVGQRYDWLFDYDALTVEV